MYSRSFLFLTLSVCFVSVFCDRKQDILFNEYGSLPSKADFYKEEYLNGQSYSVENAECKNLPKSWQKKAASVDTKGTCSRVCDEADCRGTCKYIYPSNGEQQLSTIGMAKKIVSVSGCFQNRGRGRSNDE